MPGNARRSLTALFLVGALGHVWDGAAVRSAPVDQQVSTVPFRLIGGYLIVVEGAMGRLGGRTFVIDTGTARTVIDDSIAGALGLERTSAALHAFGERTLTSAAVLPSIAFGPVEARELPVLIADLKPQAQRFGLSPDALVGMDLLRDRCITIDYATAALKFACGGRWPRSVSIGEGSGFAIVNVRIDQHPYRLLVDSGSEGVILFSEAIPAGATIEPDGEFEARHMSGTVRVKRFAPRVLSAGEYPLIPPPVFIMTYGGERAGFDGLLGPHWLRAREVRLDFVRRTMAWR